MEKEIKNLLISDAIDVIEIQAKQQILKRMKAIYQSEFNAFKDDPESQYKHGFIRAMRYCLGEIDDELEELEE